MGYGDEAMYYVLLISSDDNPLDIETVGAQKGSRFRAGNFKTLPVDAVVSTLHFTVEKSLSTIGIIA